MMGRIRSLKPEWLIDEQLAKSSDSARMLSTGLILIADDHGRGRASVELIASQVWPYDRSREVLAKVVECLARLVEIRFVSLYEVDGQSYFEIRNWRKHQRVDHPGKERIPTLAADSRESLGLSRETLARFRESLGLSRETLAPDLRPGSGSGSGREGECEGETKPVASAPAPSAPTNSKLFDDPWAIAPTGTDPDALPVASLGVDMLGDAIVEPAAPQAPPSPRARRPKTLRAELTPCPGSTDDDVDAWLASHGTYATGKQAGKPKIPPLDDLDFGAEVAAFLDRHRRKGETFVDWPAAWRTWKTNSKRFGNRLEGAAPGRAPKPGPVEAQTWPLVPHDPEVEASVREREKLGPVDVPADPKAAIAAMFAKTGAAS